MSDIYAYVDRRQREAGRQIPARRGASTAESAPGEAPGGWLAEWRSMTSSDSSSRYPVEVAYLPVVRCAVCRRTVAHRPGQASAVLTTHYQRAHPEILTAE